LRRKYEKELAPQILAMGVSLSEFWEMNPHSIEVILDGYKLKRKIADEQQWLLGGYVFSAVSTAMGNAFRKKNTKAKSYFEEVEKPFLSNIDKKTSAGLSEEEIQRRRELLMAQLRTKQSNFELKHGK
jgi:hypothetical protein